MKKKISFVRDDADFLLQMCATHPQDVFIFKEKKHPRFDVNNNLEANPVVLQRAGLSTISPLSLCAAGRLIRFLY